LNNLFIIGAQRSGSTLLAKLLEFHPKIKLISPVTPEPKYFLKDQYKGKQLYLDNFIPLNHTYDYLLEKSVSYIEHVDALKRINIDFPEAKILIILREPINRCWSNYKYSLENKVESRNFMDSINYNNKKGLNNNFSVNPFAYIERGFYEVYLAKAYANFPKENIKIIIFDEFIDSSVHLNAIFTWLGLHHIDLADDIFSAKINASHSSDISSEIINYLSPIYRESIIRLENMLEKKIYVWRDIWKERGMDI
jgi:hypothetical protein